MKLYKFLYMNDYNKYDNFWRRFFAIMIDGFVISFLNSVFELIPNFDFLIYSIFYTVVSGCIPSLYSIYMISKYEQTLGKMAMGIKVVNYKDENKVTLYQSYLRESIPLILNIIFSVIAVSIFYGEDLQNFELSILGNFIVYSTVFLAGIWSLLELVSMFFNDKSRAIHDLIAGTVVVKSR